MDNSSIINAAYVIISIVICISTFVLLLKKKKKSILLLLPIFSFILASFLQFFDILQSGKYMINKNFFEVFRLYFINDSAMIFIFCYIPAIVFGTVIPLVAIAIFALRHRFRQ
jgi:hypothetical protein